MDIKTKLPIKVTVEADSAYATICWVGVEHDPSGCFGDVEETFCESIYIGVGDCSQHSYSGQFDWSGKTISYIITQLPKTDCDPCPTSGWCELIDMYVSPYYIPYSADSTSIVYYSYWQYNEANCEITRNKVNSSVTCSFTAEETSSDFPCSADTRIVKKEVSIGCGDETRDIDFYVKMPDICCDKPSGICYEIGDVIYVDSSGSSGTQITEVEHSGGTIYFYFDYKMIDTDDKCNSKITYGRSKRIPWTIPNCEETSACCITSDIVSSYTWNDHASCIDGSSATTIPLSITRNRDYTRDDCRNVCEPSTTYCIDGDISAYTMDGNEMPSDYVFPSYGGKVKLRWNYNTYIQYDDCSSAFTSGNTWEDIVTIPPYNGDCGDGEIEGDSSINCSGSIQFTFTPSTQSQTISYPFKVAHEDDCNMVSYTYYQERTSCHEHCPSCFSIGNLHFESSGGTKTINKTCEDDFTYQELEWASISQNDEGFLITAKPNSNGEYREGTIIFSGGSEECTYPLIISQDGKEYQNPCRIIYEGEPNPIRPCDEGGVTINFSILNPNDGKAKS